MEVWAQHDDSQSVQSKEEKKRDNDNAFLIICIFFFYMVNDSKKSELNVVSACFGSSVLSERPDRITERATLTTMGLTHVKTTGLPGAPA